MKAHEIPDPGLRLAILGALIEPDERIDPELLRDAIGELPGTWEDERERIVEALVRLGGVELDLQLLEQIEALHFDGGNEIYMLIEEQLDIDTGGETDEYQLNSLVGLERLSNLRSLDLDGHGYRRAELDLAPLRGHPYLSELVLTGPCVNAAVLETLAKLRRLELRGAKLDAPEVLERLRARGVEVEGA